VRLSFLVRLAAVPLVALFLSGCSKDGESVNPTAKEKFDEVKKLPPPVNPGGKPDKGGATPVPD
jgi:hypothetical protein